MNTLPDDWQTSSFSSANTNCVEVSKSRQAVRDTKNPHGPTLANVSLEELFTAVREDHLTP